MWLFLTFFLSGAWMVQSPGELFLNPLSGFVCVADRHHCGINLYKSAN